MAAIQSRPRMQFGSSPASPPSLSRPPDQTHLTVFEPGSAEFLVNKLKGGLNCGHFPKHQVDPNSGRYPSRLGFFHESSSDGRFSVLETTKLCLSCLELAVPETFNFWSLALASSTQPGWLRPTSTEHSYPQAFLVGKEGFPLSSAPARQSLRAAVPLNIIHIPDVPNAREAWNWLQMERKPFYIDQLHIVQGWSSLRERPAAVDSKIVERSGIAFIPATPTQLDDPQSPPPIDPSSGTHTADQIPSIMSPSVESPVHKSKKSSSKTKKTSSGKGSTRPNPIALSITHSAESNNALLLSGAPSSPKAMQSSGSHKSKRTKSRRHEVASLTQPDTKITNDLTIIQQEGKITSLNPSWAPSPPMPSHFATSSPILVQPATKTRSASTSKIIHSEDGLSLSKPPAPPRPNSTPATLSSEQSVSTDQQLGKLIGCTVITKSPVVSSTIDTESKGTSKKAKDGNILGAYRGKASTAVSCSYTINWGRYDPIPFDSSTQMPSLFDYDRRAENKKATKSFRAPLPLETLLKKDKTFSSESRSSTQDIMIILDSGVSASKKKKTPIPKASADFVESIFAASGRPSDGKPLMNGPAISKPPKPKASDTSKQKEKKEKEAHKKSKLDKDFKKTKSDAKAKVQGKKASREKKSEKASAGHGTAPGHDSGSGGKGSGSQNKSSDSQSSRGPPLSMGRSGGSKQKSSSRDSGGSFFGSGKHKKPTKNKSHKDSSDSSSDSDDEKPHEKKHKKPHRDSGSSSSESDDAKPHENPNYSSSEYDGGNPYYYYSSDSELEQPPVSCTAQLDTITSEDEMGPSVEPLASPALASQGGDVNISATQMIEIDVDNYPSTENKFYPETGSQPTNPNTNPFPSQENGTSSGPSAAFPSEPGLQHSFPQENTNGGGPAPSQTNQTNQEAAPNEAKPNPPSQLDPTSTKPESEKPVGTEQYLASQSAKTDAESSLKPTAPSATPTSQHPASKPEAPASQPPGGKSEPSVPSFWGSQGAASAGQPGPEPSKSSNIATPPNKTPGAAPGNYLGAPAKPWGQENGQSGVNPMGVAAAGASGVAVGAVATTAVMNTADDDDIPDQDYISAPSDQGDSDVDVDHDSQVPFESWPVSTYQENPWGLDYGAEDELATGGNNYDTDGELRYDDEAENWHGVDPYNPHQGDSDTDSDSDAKSHTTLRSDIASDVESTAGNIHEALTGSFIDSNHHTDRDNSSSSGSSSDDDNTSSSDSDENDNSDQSSDDSDHHSEQEDHVSSDESTHSISESELGDPFELHHNPELSDGLDEVYSDGAYEVSDEDDGSSSGSGDDYDEDNDEEGDENDEDSDEGDGPEESDDDEDGYFDSD